MTTPKAPEPWAYLAVLVALIVFCTWGTWQAVTP